MGYQVPPGISDATVPNPIFNLTPAATVDEGNNWINISWGPLALTNPVTNAALGNYAPAAGSPVINYIPSSADCELHRGADLGLLRQSEEDKQLLLTRARSSSRLGQQRRYSALRVGR